MDEGLITAEQVAKMLGVSRTWVFARAKSGELPSYRLGKHVRFSREAITAWLADREQNQAAS